LRRRTSTSRDPRGRRPRTRRARFGSSGAPGRGRRRVGPEQPARVEEDPADDVRLAELGLRLLLEALLEIRGAAVRDPRAHRRVLLERARRRPEGALRLVALLVHEGLEREAVADVASEADDTVGLGLGEAPLARRAHDAARAAELRA